MRRVDLKFSKITPDEAREMQYKLSLDLAVYRVFINGYSKSGYVIFDETKLPKEKLLAMLKPFEPEVINEKELTPQELIESSLSWKNTIAA
ncbi:hypothetical protein ADU37_CDS07740 [Thermococcus sp. 2319x1]|uniref:DUF3213 domain-containing protein n=1 Tax=Thermococcus sp. 2319x1 TaxID=1674923 RepID=UPI00073A79B8|nr:DUF3213 domain-containing protein [Thermococcus sp. 2319x1]ALV62473.1 hypothetical protein ADU37_CDS07740 [Thermococcus sp. 2319x1]